MQTSGEMQMTMKMITRLFPSTCLVVGLTLSPAPCTGQTEPDRTPAKKQYRGVIGADSSKIKTLDGKTLLWAAGKPDQPDAKWYDVTDALIPVEQFQFGIGQDKIRSIDDPLFVKPDDPRLLTLSRSPYRRDERPATHDDIPVIGFTIGKEARAYPAALLDRHELVNDRISGKPVTVGW
jgi:hypothetical protein